MKTKLQKILTNKWSVASVGLCFAFGAYAASTPQLTQSITDGAKSLDIVDGSGAPVASPAAAFGALAFSFTNQTSTATNVFTATQKIRVSNPTSTATWTVNLGATNTATWTSGGNHYDFNDTTGSGYADGADTDTYGGQLTVDLSTPVVRAGVPDNTACPIANVSSGATDSFVEGSVDSIDLASGSASAPAYCRFDLTGVNLSQKIPASQPSGTYNLNMTVTVI